MSGPAAGELVDREEQLARFIVHSSYVRRDRTVRPEAFIPHPYPDLSVTRHQGLTDAEIWRIGAAVAQTIGRSLRGRADVLVATFLRQRLKVKSDPMPENPHHANVTGWPADKPAQKMIAQEIAAGSRFSAPPDLASCLRPP